ncbi:TPA: hypothetical protein DEX28_00670 [Patescibacteria group bacterium]|nr:MAG: hypothetical protein UW85_C0019G0007 [Parcubacteria group bacterium GW2011_GWA1_Parcubacteria_45_10]KKT87556.1 MAG: hypothetical protein UW89_C0024G0008 [Parcubacteria group bacterium GW2011_GWB1_45_10]HCI05242.1 hypothetical protein [Patescibacteria group bacterium]
MNSFSISKSLSLGWQKAIEHFWTLLGFFLALVVAAIIISILSAIFFWAPAISSLIVFVMQILSAFISLLLLLTFLKIAKGGKPTFDSLVDELGELFSTKSSATGKNIFFVANFAIVSVIYSLMVMLGFVALVIPGIYLAIKYSQVMYLVADKKKQLPNCKNMKLSKALRKIFQEYKQLFIEAGKLTDGVKWRYFVFLLAGFGLTLLSIIPGVLTLGLGFIFFSIMLQTAFAGIYLQLSEK